MTDSSVTCAIYARYSSELQQEHSNDDQIRPCLEYMKRQGWRLADGHIYVDRAISGTVVGRAGYQALRDAARHRLFDYIVVDDLSRLGRDIAESINAFRELNALGVHIVGVADGINTANRGAKIPFLFKSVMNDLFLDDLREKVHRGQRGQVGRNYSAGGRVYGYRSVAVPHPDGGKDRAGNDRRLGVKIEIDPEQATIVRRIFQSRAKGTGLRTICKQLSREGIPSPRFAASGKGDPTWSLGTIKGILKQEKYKGYWAWNQYSWVRIPGSKKRVRRPRPQEEWEVKQREDLRIVSDEDWRQAQGKNRPGGSGDPARRQRALANPELDNRGKFLLSGLLKCAICGANLIAITSRGVSSYCCNKHRSRGDIACPNDLRVSRALAEELLLGEIQRHFLDPTVVMRLVRELQARLDAMHKKPQDESKELAAQARELQREINNLTNFVIKGDTSDAIRAALQEREAELRVVRKKLDGLKQRQGNGTPQVSEKWVLEKLSSVRELFNRKQDKVPLIRAELLHLIDDQILMTPTGEGKDRHYVATVRGKPLAMLRDLAGVTQGQDRYSATGIRTPV